LRELSELLYCRFLHLFIFLPFSGLVPFYPSLLPINPILVAGRHHPPQR
jgi:hypothetical protein